MSARAGLPWFAVKVCDRCEAACVVYELVDGTGRWVTCPWCRGEGFTQETYDAGEPGIDEAEGN